MIRRELLEHGSVRLVSDRCRFTYEPTPRSCALLITIDGDDSGQFGHATLDEIDRVISHSATPLRVFVDATRATGPTAAVMELWTAWLASRREKLEKVVVLIPEGSKLLHLTVSIAQHLSRTGGLITICSDEAEFKSAAGRGG